jgi:hypothetical protein
MRTFIVAVALAALAIPAFAGTDYTATPAQPSSKIGFLAGSVVWDCGAGGCRSTSDTTAADALTACRNLTHEVGELSALSNGGQAIASDRLPRCNAGAQKGKS